MAESVCQHMGAYMFIMATLWKQTDLAAPVWPQHMQVNASEPWFAFLQFTVALQGECTPRSNAKVEGCLSCGFLQRRSPPLAYWHCRTALPLWHSYFSPLVPWYTRLFKSFCWLSVIELSRQTFLRCSTSSCMDCFLSSSPLLFTS